MSSTRNQHYLVASELSPNMIVAFKTDSELKKYIQQKTNITKTFFTLGEIIATLRIIIEREKQYDERNPALIICSEDLKLALKRKALHSKDLQTAITSHLAFNHEYLGEVGEPNSPNNKNVATHICISKKAQFKLKKPFLGLIQSTSRFNQNRTVFTYEEICALVCRYIKDRKDKFFHDKDIKICWVQDDLLGTCFNVKAFHYVQLGVMIWSQLRTCYVRTRKSKRLWDKTE